MISGIGAGMAGEFARLLSEGRSQADRIAQVHRRGAEIAARAATAAGNAADEAQRAAERSKLAASIAEGVVGVAQAAQEGGPEAEVPPVPDQPELPEPAVGAKSPPEQTPASGPSTIEGLVAVGSSAVNVHQAMAARAIERQREVQAHLKERSNQDLALANQAERQAGAERSALVGLFGALGGGS